MSGDRLSIPQDSDYFQAVGLAIVAFARLEWGAVWCCERLETGYIYTIEPRKKTAGTIAADLKRLFSRIADPRLQSKIIPFANEFLSVVDARNSLLHGKPGTACNGDQRLFRHGDEWSINKVNEFSDRCALLCANLNELLHDEFKAPCCTRFN